jgi:hypothetical protein
LIVTLSHAELHLAAQAGVTRQTMNLYRKRVQNHNADDEDGNQWNRHIEGCLTEFSVAKLLGLNWSPFEFRGMDVPGFQVRSTTWQGGHMLLHKEDDAADRFILAVGANGRYDIRGWILAKDGMLPALWRDPVGDRNRREGVDKPRPAFWVPQKLLLPMKQLVIPPPVRLIELRPATEPEF